MFVIEIAGLSIGIDNKYFFVERQCCKYIVKKQPLFTVSISEEEIEKERNASAWELRQTVKELSGYAESVCIYRKICKMLPVYDAFLLHSAALECSGRAYLFAAPSGTGKSTHLRLWMKNFGNDLRIINGDKPILRKTNDGEFAVYGTPWAGKEGWQENRSAPLKAVCFLMRGTENHIERLSAEQAAERIFSQVLYPEEPLLLSKELFLLDEFVKKIPFYLLACDISDEAAKLSFETMTGECSM